MNEPEMNNKSFESRGLESLERIESDLEALKPSPKRTFLNGMLYGAGAFVGGILSIVLAGWILFVAGFIPGFSEIADIVNAAIKTRTR